MFIRVLVAYSSKVVVVLSFRNPGSAFRFGDPVLRCDVSTSAQQVPPKVPVGVPPLVIARVRPDVRIAVHPKIPLELLQKFM